MISKYIFNLNIVTKSYGKKEALSSLSFNIEKGEKIALIGPSGSGKTTLLNVLSKTIEPDTGDLVIDGLKSQDYINTKQLSKKIGIIRQQYDLVPQLSVIHNVLAGKLGEWTLFKSLLSLIFPQEKGLALNSLKRVGLLNKEYERTSNLSGGEQQRVALARLLVQSPEIILADEPVSSLDPARAEDILFMLIKLVKEEKQTLIASLHSIEYAKKYFTRLIGLRDGKIHFDLPVEKVTDKHITLLYRLEDSDNDK